MVMIRENPWQYLHTHSKNYYYLKKKGRDLYVPEGETYVKEN